MSATVQRVFLRDTSTMLLASGSAPVKSLSVFI